MFTLLATLALSIHPAHAGTFSAGTITNDVDGSNWEVFAGSVMNYGGDGSSNLVNTTPGVNAYLTQMWSVGYTSYLHEYDEILWSSDWEQSGSDWLYNDRGDYNYFSGHGNTGGFYMHGTSGNNEVLASETRWGDQDADLVALDSCLSLNSTGRTNFGTNDLNQGVHWIMGFDTTAKDVQTTAANFGTYLRNGYYVDSAWILATSDGHNATHIGALVRFYNSSCNTYWDKATTASCDPRSSSSYITQTWST